jgi:hypothetical protein
VASEKDVLTDCQNQVLPVEDDDSIVAPGRIPGRRCVLLVEDDEATREVIKHQLAGLQVHTIEAAGGNQAIELTRKESPDLIILDLGLPKTSGFDVVTALRLEKASTTPLLVYTARDLDNTEKSALTLGITAHLTKSRTSEKDFLSKVSDLLNGIVRVDKDTNTGAEESTNTIAERGGNS